MKVLGQNFVLGKCGFGVEPAFDVIPGTACFLRRSCSKSIVGCTKIAA